MAQVVEHLPSKSKVQAIVLQKKKKERSKLPTQAINVGGKERQQK
jgi:hypothetical protein